ncbi:MAG: LacI family DNA-binding transcriptional regulator [Eubacteriales bacterium]|nr:LacI family DNA-binding transcriptional regulator [Eubacteriales bacterium]
MAVTIKEIAEVSGVSRGTVDRVLNNRGKVNPQTEKKVRECAERLGYKPNFAGKALAAKKKNYTVGIIISSNGNVFFDDVLCGIKDAAKVYEEYSIKVVLKTMKGYDADTQLKLIESIEDNISGLIIAPIDEEIIINKINDLTEKGIGVITLNTDVKNSNRFTYVGTDYYKGGQIAAGIVNIIKDVGNIGIVQGSNKIYSHNQRVLGFKDEIKKYKGLKILDMFESEDDDITSYEKTIKMLQENKDIDIIFIVAAGVYGVCRAVIQMKRDISIVCFDEIPTTIEMLKKGIIKATISQQPKLQGQKVMDIMFEYLIKGEKPSSVYYIIENQIKIKQSY